MQVQKINNRKVFEEDSDNLVELISSLHNHKPNMDEVQQAVVDSLATMQLRASTENLTPGDIYHQEQAKLTVKLGSTELAASLPELTQISTTLYNRKHEKNIIFSVFIFISMRIYVHI
jgi:N-glycosylase/DNA lyase